VFCDWPCPSRRHAHTPCHVLVSNADNAGEVEGATAPPAPPRRRRSAGAPRVPRARKEKVAKAAPAPEDGTDKPPAESLPEGPSMSECEGALVYGPSHPAVRMDESRVSHWRELDAPRP
jgi:hypothetical protein